GLEVGSIWRIQGIRYGVLEFLGVGTTLDIFQNIHKLYLQYGVLTYSGYNVLLFIPLWSLTLFDVIKLSQGASGSNIFTIELYTFPNKSWVYDTGCGTHICNTTQGLRGSRKLKPVALCLYVSSGQRAAVKAIGSFHLCLPSGLVIVLNNCHYAPFITRGIISVSRLYDDGFVNHFVDNAILVFRNNLVYFSVVPRDGIFEIDLSNCNTNDTSMYAVSNKRAKLNLDFTLS
ncbi:hypothetical protein Tco_0503195, partial [Tanacetum coccineum]